MMRIWELFKGIFPLRIMGNAEMY